MRITPKPKLIAAIAASLSILGATAALADEPQHLIHEGEHLLNRLDDHHYDHDRDWVKISQRRVDRDDHRVRFDVDPSNRFRRIALRVDEAPAHIERCIVDFGNGEKQDIDLDRSLQPGESTGPVDLYGGNLNPRHIRNIEVVLRLHHHEDRGRALLTVYGIR